MVHAIHPVAACGDGPAFIPHITYALDLTPSRLTCISNATLIQRIGKAFSCFLIFSTEPTLCMWQCVLRLSTTAPGNFKQLTMIVDIRCIKMMDNQYLTPAQSIAVRSQPTRALYGVYRVLSMVLNLCSSG